MNKSNLKLGVVSLLFLGSIFFYSCSSSDDNDITNPTDPETPILVGDLKLANSYAGERSKLIRVAPDLSQFNNAKVAWKVIEVNGIEKDSLISEEESLYFISLKEGSYKIEVDVTDSKSLASHKFNMNVTKEKEPYKTHLTKVFDFLPSYGQFTNDLPKYEAGDSKERMIEKVENAIAREKPSMISLGGYGGYVVFGFDHTIPNIPGKRDFRVNGNAFWAAANPNPEAPGRGGSCEPGIIMVAYDKNQNGIPDEDEWYEIAGSEHSNPKTIKNYEITFHRPDPNKIPVKDPSVGWATDLEYIYWEDNQGNKGWKPKNSFHHQSYFPEWIKEDKISFKGTLLRNNAIDESGQGSYWVQYSFEWGYADNAPNIDDESAIDIGWAVNKEGNKVHLPGVDFIKVYTGVNQEAGWLGETSTEVAGAFDLHEQKIDIPTRN